MKIIYSFLIISIVLMGCSEKKELFVSFSNPKIEFSGRIDTSKIDAAELYWSGSSIKINFEGESIEALLKDESRDNYYNIILDNDSIVVLRLDTIKQYYQLASNLPKGKHSIKIFKRAEWDRGKTSFYGFKLNKGAKILPKSLSKNRKIEFYGNSITAGYAIEDTTGKDSPEGTFTNNYLSYAAITARHYDAKYKCICRSGIGVTVSWIPQIMPEIYDRLNPLDSNSKWNLSADEPDIVVVNLFQNDTWLVNLPEHKEFKKRFGTKAPSEKEIINAYQQFIGNLRNQYPKADIICTLGGMDAAKEGSKWKEYIKTAVANIDDKKMHTHFMPYLKSKGHPTINDQQTMAKSLIEFIDSNIEW
jgi:hypothetical protein